MRIAAEKLTHEPIKRIVKNGGKKKRDCTAEKNKPSTAKNGVEGGIIVSLRGNSRGDKKHKTTKQVNTRGKYRNTGGCARSEMLGYNIHTHKGKPGYQYTAVKGDPIKLKKRFGSKKIHTYDADYEKRHHRGGNTPQKHSGLPSLTGKK
jgi:hypothetical protein